jgi:hypothetical protein
VAKAAIPSTTSMMKKMTKRIENWTTELAMTTTGSMGKN